MYKSKTVLQTDKNITTFTDKNRPLQRKWLTESIQTERKTNSLILEKHSLDFLKLIIRLRYFSQPFNEVSLLKTITALYS